MELKGENECHACGETIEWLGHIWEGGTEVILFGTRNEAELIAKGKLQTSHGKAVQYDVIVKCPRCHTKNRFETVK